MAKSPPKDLERQINVIKWEEAEQYLQEHPKVNEIVVQLIPNQHLYKIIRGENNQLIRLHYDRICKSCNRFFLHKNGEDKLFTCQDCLNKK